MLQLGGYVGTFDVRDHGTYTLQVIVAWFFGSMQPPTPPTPINVGTFGMQCCVLAYLPLRDAAVVVCCACCVLLMLMCRKGTADTKGSTQRKNA